MTPPDAVATEERNAVTAHALDLLRRAANYLDRLPAVPATRQLARELAEFSESPKVQATERAMRARAVAASARCAHVSAPTGLTLFQAVVEGNALYLKAPPIGGYLDDLGRMRKLHEGIRFDLVALPSEFVPWHLDLIDVPYRSDA